MKSMMRLSAAGSVLALAGTLAFSGQAVADQVTATFNALNPATVAVTAWVRLPPGSDNPLTRVDTAAGAFEFINASGPIEMIGPANNEFVSFCIDLEDSIRYKETKTWNVVALASAPDASAGPMGATKADDLAKLLGAVITTGKLNDAKTLGDDQRAALQIAIWEVVHEKPGTPYDITDGDATFTVKSTVQDLAQGYLGQIANGTARMAGLVGLTSGETQDMLAQVPIPAAAWLFGSALLGVAALGRRRRKETEDSETLA